jgi:GDPmannose 4,6-dehydratase
MKTALIIGSNGMDGSHLCDLLLSKGYSVHGTIRRSSVITTERIDHIYSEVTLHYIDLTDPMAVFSVIAKVKPDEIYNFAAQSHVQVSAQLENYTFQTNTLGVLNILQAVRTLNMEKTCKIYQASTSEEFGNGTDGTILLNEQSEKMPVSIYGISKLAAEHICRVYREAYGMFIVSSTLFNHEGPRRGHTFVTQKITNHIGQYVKTNGSIASLNLGNLNAKRDWGSARDYVEAIWLMMQRDIPDNYVIATGETHSVREFVQLAFAEIGVTVEWNGQGVDEIGYDVKTGQVLVKVNPRYFRDLELHTLIGDASKAKRELNWEPKTTFPELVKEMVSAAIERAQNN